MNIIIAMAMSQDNKFANSHFGDADKYLIYYLDEKTCIPVSEIENSFKKEDEKAQHGSQKKGKSIVNLLKSFHVNVLISSQFGPNIKIVAKYFVPVIVKKENLEEVCESLVKNYRWIEDELEIKKEMHRKFIMGDGVLKTNIDE